MALDAQAAFGHSLFVYRIIGADGKEYGPCTATQLSQWVAEGRVNAETRVAGEGSTEWKPLGSFPEFSHWFARPATPPTAAPAVLTGLAPARRTHGLAVASLVMGIISVTIGICCCYGLPFNVLGVIFALIALSQIRQSPQLYDGEGAAIVGLVLSLLSLALMAVLIPVLGLHSTWHELRHHMHRL